MKKIITKCGIMRYNVIKRAKNLSTEDTDSLVKRWKRTLKHRTGKREIPMFGPRKSTDEFTDNFGQNQELQQRFKNITT